MQLGDDQKVHCIIATLNEGNMAQCMQSPLRLQMLDILKMKIILWSEMQLGDDHKVYCITANLNEGKHGLMHVEPLRI